MVEKEVKRKGLYSEKVMDLFLHPHNAGEIKDADGAGEVGNPICLPPDQLIVANPEEKEISSISVGERVFGHDGTFHEVAAINSRNFEGELVVLRNCFGETKLTPEHKIFAVKVPKKWRFLYSRNKKTLNPDWVSANLLEKGDLCVYPVLKDSQDVLELKTDSTRKRFDYKSVGIPEKVAVDADFLRLAGYFLSEGSLVEKTTKVHACFTFSSKEVGFAEDVSRIVGAAFGLKTVKRLVAERHSLHVVVNNVHFVRFFKSLFGNGADKKAIPDFMMRLPPVKQLALLKGLWLGDGFLNKRIPRAGYSTISRKLAEQVKMLLLRRGIACSFYVEGEKTVRGVHHKKAYRIHVGRSGAEKIAEILGEGLKVSKPISVDRWFRDGYAFVPTTSVKRESYSGLVYDLAVEDSHSFTTPSLSVHNCGDLMRIFIKVDEASQRLTDVKFQTFGCASAIATSSMITDLAKGKTLEEALKITRNDVADELGGLPPIKLHCSNLAADALHEAIYDYLKKNGKTIPPELEREHERHVREAKSVEAHETL